MTKQILKVECGGSKYTVERNDRDKLNQYRVYQHSYRYNEFNQPCKSKRMVNKYANFSSALYDIADMFRWAEENS